MLVKDFLTHLKGSENQPLLFEIGPGDVVQGGYHITEIKNSTYETIDCGNSLHTWKEVIVQVWVPAEAKAGDPWMPSDKFMKIWDVVDSRLALFKDAEIRIEFGDATHLTSNYHVDGFANTEDGLIVQMAPPRTMCKPREILIEPNEMSAETVASSCCTPSPRQETSIPLAMAEAENSSSCC
ncbi:MAG: DUF6428 family protein [Chloroflexota bacterium]